jgi:peptidyl-prolyl cis-trans isomerase SurA
MKRFFLLSSVILFSLLSIAQNAVIDQVVWIVGDEAILRSEIEEQRLRAQYEGMEIKGDPYCIIPEQMAVQKLFLHQAQLDSIEAADSQVNSQVEMRINYFLSQIGSKEKMEEYFRKPLNEIREDITEMVRNQMIIQQMQQKITGDIKPTPAEIRHYYSELPADSIPIIPTQVEVQIITIAPPVPREEIDRVKDRLREFTDRINAGTATFSMLARIYSEDTESAKQGGELGFMGKGQLVPEFANVAFSLTDPNRVSRIVETEFGFHIIQMIEKRGDRMNVRHILLRPKTSAQDRQKAMALLDSIGNDVRAGKMTFETAVATFSQDKNTVMNNGVMQNENMSTSKFEYQQLPQEVAKVVYKMKVGEISDPFVMIDRQSNKEVCAIVKLKSKVDTHKADLTNDFQTIKQQLVEQTSERIIQNWIKKKIQETYIMIDPEWVNCDFEYEGWVNKTK